MEKPLLLLVVSLTVPQLLPAADLLVAGFTADKVIRYDGTTGAAGMLAVMFAIRRGRVV